MPSVSDCEVMSICVSPVSSGVSLDTVCLTSVTLTLLGVGSMIRSIEKASGALLRV